MSSSCIDLPQGATSGFLLQIKPFDHAEYAHESRLFTNSDPDAALSGTTPSRTVSFRNPSAPLYLKLLQVTMHCLRHLPMRCKSPCKNKFALCLFAAFEGVGAQAKGPATLALDFRHATCAPIHNCHVMHAEILGKEVEKDTQSMACDGWAKSLSAPRMLSP